MKKKTFSYYAYFLSISALYMTTLLLAEFVSHQDLFLLLLSLLKQLHAWTVLPRFVALEMITDIAREEERGDFQPAQFHKIYIHRYDDVSILFADIKGFTGMSVSIDAHTS